MHVPKVLVQYSLDNPRRVDPGTEVCVWVKWNVTVSLAMVLGKPKDIFLSPIISNDKSQCNSGCITLKIVICNPYSFI